MGSCEATQVGEASSLSGSEFYSYKNCIDIYCALCLDVRIGGGNILPIANKVCCYTKFYIEKLFFMLTSTFI